MLNKEQILSTSDLQIKKVHVPEWNGDVYVRSLTGTERDKWEKDGLVITQGAKQVIPQMRPRMDNTRARLVVLTCCDEQGNRLFSDDDIEVLGRKNSAALSLLYNVAASLSGITEEDLEDLLKNSKPDLNGSSTSG